MCDEDTFDTIMNPILQLESLIEPDLVDEPTGHEAGSEVADTGGVPARNVAQSCRR